MENKKPIGAFWLQTAKSGLKYMSGKINDEAIVVFKNNYKEKENQPDYLIYKSEPKTEIKQEQNETSL